MALSNEIAPVLPYLRRYARAVCGSQQDGDDQIIATLEALVSDPGLAGKGDSLRVSLYRLFTSVLSTAPPIARADDSTGMEEPAPGQQQLNRMTPRPRQAFLLRAVEGFSIQEIAKILGVNDNDVVSLISDAGKEIARQVVTDVLIIEDDAAVANDIETVVRDLGHRVSGIARTHDEALAVALAKPPRLVLADVELADGSSGLDAVNDLLAVARLPVIFITALPERLLTGKRPEPAFLITKPYSIDAVKATISQALFFDFKASQAA